MYSKAKFLGHSIHPMLVHFPIAFYAATLIAYVAYAATMNPFWFQLGVVANIAGVVAAAAAAVPGFIDWATIPNERPAKTTGLQHMALNVGALVLFGVDAGMQFSHWNELEPAYGAAIGLSAVGLALTLGAGFLGSKMVEKQHVGIELTAEQNRIDIGREAGQPGASHRAVRGS
jgi:uncharacterized membrane protein